MPTFSVVMATWNRGRHILPSVRSVLAQDHPDFELIVVGDACDDDTAEVLTPLFSDRIGWINLARRAGTQSGPNNAGLRAARGTHVAYCGHDDIWDPRHLSALDAAYVADPGADFAVSGCVLHGGAGRRSQVTGLFEEETAAFDHFFPPTSLSHSLDAWREVGDWRLPSRLRLPVDAEFQLRAALAGCRFRSSGIVTAHKFAAAARYLSYLLRSSDEQEAMLARLAAGEGPAIAEAAVAEARARGSLMTMTLPDPRRHAPGQIYGKASSSRGLGLPPPVPVCGEVRIAQGAEARGGDWHLPARRDAPGTRWSGPNPRPRLLLPVAATHPIEIAIEVAGAAPGFFDTLGLRLNDAPVPWSLREETGRRWLVLRGTPKPDAPSVLEFDGRTAMLSGFGARTDARRVGICVGEMVFRPLA
jgi:hypothetical protein